MYTISALYQMIQLNCILKSIVVKGVVWCFLKIIIFVYLV